MSILAVSVLALAPSFSAWGGALSATSDPDDVGPWIEKLASPSAVERTRAQRFLALHLTPDDAERVSTAIDAGDAEVRGRLTEAIAAEDDNLELAVRLSQSGSAAPARVGRESIESMIERWNPGSPREPMPKGPLREALTEKLETRVVLPLAARFAGRLEDAVDLCVRCVPRSPAIAIDPELLRGPARFERFASGANIDAPFGLALFDLASAARCELEGFGFEKDADGRSVPWLVLVPRADAAKAPRAGDSALQLVLGWTLACAAKETGSSSASNSRSAGSTSVAARSDAARALAACGWPAGIAWLAERWRSSGSRNDLDGSALPFLDGALLAARRGLVARPFLEPDVQRDLRAVRDAELARANPDSDRRALAVALALGATGVSGPRGEDLVAPTLQSPELQSMIAFGSPASPGSPDASGTLGARALWLALVELEGRRSNAPEASAALDRLLASESLPPAVRMQALRARASAPGAPGTIAGPAALVEWCADRDEGERRARFAELDALLLPCPCWPPAAWRDPRALPFAGRAEPCASVIAGWLERGEVATAAEHLVALLGRASEPEREHLAERLHEVARRGERERLVQLFTRALELPDADAALVARSAALSGAAPGPALATRAFDSIAPGPLERREDLLVAAALAAGPRRNDARDRLIAAALVEASVEDQMAAYDRAIVELRAVRDEEGEKDLVRRLRAAVRDGRPALRSRLRVDQWPPAAQGVAVRPGDFDRGFASAGL